MTHLEQIIQDWKTRHLGEELSSAEVLAIPVQAVKEALFRLLDSDRSELHSNVFASANVVRLLSLAIREPCPACHQVLTGFVKHPIREVAKLAIIVLSGLEQNGDPIKALQSELHRAHLSAKHGRVVPRINYEN